MLRRGKSSLFATSRRWPQYHDITNKTLGNVVTLARTSRRHLVFRTINVHTLLSDNSKSLNVLSDFYRCSCQIPSKLYQSSSQPSLATSKALCTSQLHKLQVHRHFWLSSGLDLVLLPLFLGCLCPRRYPRVGWGFLPHLSSIKTTIPLSAC